MDVFSLIPRVTSLKLFYYRPVKTLASCGSRRSSENESRDALRVFRTNASLELRRTRFVTRDHLETNHKKVVFLTKSEHFQNIIVRWPDKPSVCRRLAPTSSDQQQESAATSRARWWIALLPKSAERRVRTSSPSRRAFSDVLHSYFRETNLRVVTLKHARCCL